MNRRKLAEKVECQARFIGYCKDTPDHETVCLRHIRRGGIAGGSQKPPDDCAFIGCYWCDAMAPDGWPKEPVTDTDILEAMCRTNAYFDSLEAK